MSPPSAPQPSKPSKNPSKSNSHTYFSRLSKRFFKSSSTTSASLDPPGSPPPPPQFLHSSKATQRLSSLKRKSTNYFSAQARNRSASPDLEGPPSSHADSEREQQEIFETMYAGDMGNQASTPTPCDATAPVLRLRPRETSIFNQSDETGPRPHSSSMAYPADETASSKGETKESRPMGFGSVELFPKREAPSPPPAAVTTMMTTTPPTTMKRPLPPPKSRHAVREEAKRGIEIVDITDDVDKVGPTIKRMKTGLEGITLQPVTQAVQVRPDSSRAAGELQGVHNSQADEQQMHDRTVRTVGGGSSISSSSNNASDVQNGEASAENAPTNPEKKKKKKKLFGALNTNGLSTPLQYHGTISNRNTVSSEKPDIDPHPLDIPSTQAGNSGSESANNGAFQHANGPRRNLFHNQANSMFIDEGYGSFCVPDCDDDDGNEHVPENEDELMARINGSLGHSSPFVQHSRAKAPKVVTREQAYAEKQRERDVQRSRRMREANLSAKEEEEEQKWNLALKQTTTNGGRSLSVGFLEDVEPRTINRVDSMSAQQKRANGASARSEHQEECLGLADGDMHTISRDRDKNRPADAHNTSIINQPEGHLTDAALLDIAESYVRNHGPNGSVKASQRSSASNQPFQKLAANSEVLGSRDGDGTQTGFLQLLEQQLRSGEHGGRLTGASDAASRKSIISQLAPKRKKRPELSTPQAAATTLPHEACDSQAAAEARLLALRNAPVSGNTSSAKQALPTLRQEGGLLAQLARERERHENLSTEILVSGQENHFTEVKSTPEPMRKARHRRAKGTVAAAEVVLLRMGVPASVFKDWKDDRKIKWMKRENHLTPKQADFLIRLIANHDILQNEDRTPASVTEMQRDSSEAVAAKLKANLGTASSKRKPNKQSSDKAAATEAILRNLGLEKSEIERLSNKQKPQWARLETELAVAKQNLDNFRAKQDAQERKTWLPDSSTKTGANDFSATRDTVLALDEDAESEESEEEEGWECALRWQGIEQPKTLADAIPLDPDGVIPDMGPEESESGEDEDEEEQDLMEDSEVQDQVGPGWPRTDTRIVPQDRFPNRQKPDTDLLRQMQRNRYNDWSDEEDDQVHEYVVKAESWGMTNFPAHHILILGRYLDQDKAEEMVRNFILRCKPHEVGRMLEIQSVWSDGNFSQKMIRDGEAGCRAFVEPEIVSVRQYPGLKDKVGRRRVYAVLFERTISRNMANGEVEEDVTGTTMENMQMFTTKSLANWQAKKHCQEWTKEHLTGPNDWHLRRELEENLCRQVEELNEEGLLFTWNDDVEKGGATDAIKVWVKEIAPQGPRN